MCFQGKAGNWVSRRGTQAVESQQGAWKRLFFRMGSYSYRYALGRGLTGPSQITELATWGLGRLSGDLG